MASSLARESGIRNLVVIVPALDQGGMGCQELGGIALIIDRDYLSCAEDDIRRIEPITTIVNGQVVSGRL